MYNNAASAVRGQESSFGVGIGVGRGRGFGNFNPQPKNPGGWNPSSAPVVNNYNASVNGAGNDSSDFWDDGRSSNTSFQKDNKSGWQEEESKSGWQEEESTGGWKEEELKSGWQEKDSKSGWGDEKSNKGGWTEDGSSSWNNKDSGRSSRPERGFSSGGNRKFGSDSNRGFRKNYDDADDEVPKGGGMRSRGGGKGCFKCGEEGHMSRECPNNDSRGDRKSGCFKCGEDGHISRECPNGGGGGNRGDRSGCFKCGEDGHMSRDCPNGGGGGNRGDRSGCFKCGEDGHMSRDCPNGGGGNRGNRSGCFKCGEDGHMSRDCPNSGGGGNRGDRSGCFKCGEEGHMSRECPNSNSDGRGEKKSGCFRCGGDGHMAKDCPNPDTRTGPDGKPRVAPYVPPEPAEDEHSLFEGVPTGINFDKYDSIPVNVSGEDPPKCIHSFQEANFRNLLQTNINKSQYTRPTPIQKYAIPIVLQKRDLMACAQTGSGKTAAFLLPMLQHMFEAPDLPNNSFKEVQEPWAVIISPTRELAIQIYNEARKFSHGSVVKVELIYGGTSVGYQSSRLQKGCHILVATPGRLLDFVEKGKVSFRQLKYLVLDEADRMLDMGFAPEVHRMVENPQMPPKGTRQTLMFSATFPEKIQELAAEFLDRYLFLVVGIVGAANTDVQQAVFQVSQFEKRNKLMEIVSNSGQDRVLVFVELKRTADFIASFMSQSGLPTTSIHGDRMQREREEALRDFRTGRMPILVATAVAARGLDIKDVRHVINYDLPQSIDEYVHRIGRTGRVGNIGKATSFYDTEVDQPLAQHLVKILQAANQVVPAWLLEEAGKGAGYSYSGGRGRFGARDVRSKGRGGGGGGGDNWKSDTYNEDYGSNTATNVPVAIEDSWD